MNQALEMELLRLTEREQRGRTLQDRRGDKGTENILGAVTLWVSYHCKEVTEVFIESILFGMSTAMSRMPVS